MKPMFVNQAKLHYRQQIYLVWVLQMKQIYPPSLFRCAGILVYQGSISIYIYSYIHTHTHTLSTQLNSIQLNSTQLNSFNNDFQEKSKRHRWARRKKRREQIYLEVLTTHTHTHKEMWLKINKQNKHRNSNVNLEKLEWVCPHCTFKWNPFDTLICVSCLLKPNDSTIDLKYAYGLTLADIRYFVQTYLRNVTQYKQNTRINSPLHHYLRIVIVFYIFTGNDTLFQFRWNEVVFCIFFIFVCVCFFYIFFVLFFSQFRNFFLLNCVGFVWNAKKKRHFCLVRRIDGIAYKYLIEWHAMRCKLSQCHTYKLGKRRYKKKEGCEFA